MWLDLVLIVYYSEMDEQKTFDIDHVEAPTGEEYAVVEKKKPNSSKSTSSDNQLLYQVGLTALECEQLGFNGLLCLLHKLQEIVLLNPKFT